MDYHDFLHTKQHTSLDQGFKPLWIPERAFDFQKYIIEKALFKGRCAIFADTGLGKTLMQLAIAKNIVMHTNKRCLILTPLAVAFQFIDEAAKIGIDDIEYSKNGKFTKKIVICNYERLKHFNPSDFDGVVLDESSILKNFDGTLKHSITTFMKKVKYRFTLTATPSPNDYIELGTTSEALGALGYTDMLSKFFKNNQNNTVKASSAANANAGMKWYLKPHAEADFWRWISTWAISVRKPSDLGFSDDGYDLPPMNEVQTIVDNNKQLVIDGQVELFTRQAESFRDIKAEVRQTLTERCEAAVEKCQAVNDFSVCWVNLNDEAKAIRDIGGSDYYEISGSMSIDKKEELLLAFSKGDIKKLITKTSITAFGLNWQHCNHTTYFPTYSYEQYYQAIRRFWRFGQKREVTADLILSEGQKKIMATLQVKKDKAVDMFKKLNESMNSKFTLSYKEFDQSIKKPKF